VNLGGGLRGQPSDTGPWRGLIVHRGGDSALCANAVAGIASASTTASVKNRITFPLPSMIQLLRSLKPT
jgi:hypothetical protein